jgi:hypothetical protein
MSSVSEAQSSSSSSLLTFEASSSQSSSVSQLPSSSSSVAVISAEEKSATAITENSLHLFDSYYAVLSFLKSHAIDNGFEVRLRPAGGEEKATHG